MSLRQQVSDQIDKTAAIWMTEFRNQVGGVFEDKRWHGHCAKYFKDAILPLLDKKQEVPVGEVGDKKEKAGRFGARKTK